jgi:cell division ATPase FtsA
MRFFKRKAKNRNLIILDLGTQFIKALLLEIDKNSQKGIVRALTKESFKNDKAAACQRAIKYICEKSKIRTNEVFVGTGNNILKGKTTAFCFKRDEPNQKIDLAEIKYLIQKIQWRALDSMRREFAQETEFSELSARLVGAFMADIRVDSRSTSDPIGLGGQNICLSIFNVYTALKWLDNLRSFIDGLGLKLTGFIPIAYALFRGLDLEKSPKGDALIVDVGSKITEVTLARSGGETIETKSFHLGGQVFTNVLAEFLGLSTEQAEELKIKYSQDELSHAAKKKIEKLFIANASSWLKGVKIVFSDFAQKYKSLPEKIFLCGEGSKMPLLEKELKKEKGFRINRIEEMPILSLAKLCPGILKEEGIFLPILKRVTRLIQG